jgi:hypothetical protein
MRISDLGYYSSLLRQRQMMAPQLTEEEAEMVETGPYYGMRDVAGTGGEDAVVGFVGAGVLGVVAYLLLANAGKWNNPWSLIGRIGGSISSIAAARFLFGGIFGLISAGPGSAGPLNIKPDPGVPLNAENWK